MRCAFLPTPFARLMRSEEKMRYRAGEREKEQCIQQIEDKEDENTV